MTAIKSVSYYRAAEITTCSRCGQVIKNVAHVTYRDGLVERYGMDCIEKILEAEPSLISLFKKNAKLARKYSDYIAILTGPADKMPRGREYFNSGLYFIADSEGKDIMFERWYFHPEYDAAKNAVGPHYVVKDAAAHVARAAQEIERALPKMRAELARIEGFLARVIAKGLATQAQAAAAAVVPD